MWPDDEGMMLAGRALAPWIKEAPWGSARKLRKQHAMTFHQVGLALLTPGDVEWGADRLCPVCLGLRKSGYAEKFRSAFASQEAPDDE